MGLSFFAKSDYNIRFLIREIALTGIYQRSFQLPANLAPSVDEAQKSLPELKKLVETSTKLVEEKQTAADALLEQLDAALAEAVPFRTACNKAVSAGQAAAKKRNDTATALAAKKTSYEAKQKQATSLGEVATKAKAAADILKEDKELAAAAAKFDAKAKAQATEAVKLKAAVAAATKPATDAATALAAATKAIEPHLSKLTPAETKIRETRTSFIAAQQELYSHRETLRSTERRIEFLESLIALNSAEIQLASLNKELPSVTTAEATAKKDAATATAMFNSATTDMKTAAANATSTEATLNATKTNLAKQQQASKLLGETLTSARASLKQLPQDVDLAQAVAKLDASADRIAKVLAASQTALPSQTKAAADAKSALAATKPKLETATATHQAAMKKASELSAKLAQMKDQLAKARATATESTETVVKQATSQFNIAYVDPLTPEQLAVSMMQATGRANQLRGGEAARINKATPLSKEDKKDPAKVAARDAEIDEATWVKALASSAGFVNLFAGQKGQPQDAFFATVDQALFFANGGDVRTWLTPSGTNLTGRALKLEDPKAVAEELYLGLLTRLPTDEESGEVADYLAQRKDDKSGAIQEIGWALITSSEFRFHH